MLTGLENGFGLDVVLWVQAHGSPFLDFLAQAIHVLGSPSWYLFLLLPLLLRGLQRQRTYQWVFTLVVAILLTDALKLIAQAPRPSWCA